MTKYRCIKKYPHGPKVGKEIFDSWEGEPRSLANFPEYWQELKRFKEVDQFNGYKVGDVIHIKRWWRGENTKGFNSLFNSISVDVKVAIDKITINEITGKDTLWCGKFSTSSTDVANKGIVENYQILTFRDRKTNDKYHLNMGNYCLDNKYLPNPLETHAIHCVKRLSDGQIFTIGDKFENELNQVVEIEHMKIATKSGSRKKGLYMWKVNNGGVFIENAKIHKPLFKSIDGEDVYKFDVFYVVNEKYFNITEARGGHFQNEKWQKFRFSKKENAEQYVIKNKPCLSLIEIETIVNENDIEDIRNELINLIRTKI